MDINGDRGTHLKDDVDDNDDDNDDGDDSGDMVGTWWGHGDDDG